ncbi:hypothetical protein [Desulfocicer vacuolatum]|uniref:hypothetical protein n=1 Tax=Desulfocicer vacuolatum TaxID=2298 RepID=UPI00111C14D9|nr:hypothetical protein [Desulfocicer vacuolatum]
MENSKQRLLNGKPIRSESLISGYKEGFTMNKGSIECGGCFSNDESKFEREIKYGKTIYKKRSGG